MFTQEITVEMILTALWYVLGGFGIGFFFEKIVLVRLRASAKKSESEAALLMTNALRGIGIWSIGLLGISYGIETLPLKPFYADGLHTILVLATILIVTWIARNASIRLVSVYTQRPNTPFPSSSIFTLLTQLSVLSVGILIALQYAGISITPLITAMGVGGLALALGLQDTIGNLFAGLTILASKKIVPGDIIEVEGGKQGTVKDISWRYTTLETSSGDTVVLPNAKLAAELVTNFSQPVTDVSFSVDLRVPYDSDLEKIEVLLQKIAYDVLQKKEGGNRDYVPLVRFQSFGEMGIDVKILLKAETYAAQFALKHICIKEIHTALQKEGIVIPQYITKE